MKRAKTTESLIPRSFHCLETPTHRQLLEYPAIGEVPQEFVASQEKLKAGQVFGHYRVGKKIGAGGMGEVFLAEDTSLRRRVLSKIERGIANSPAA